MDNLCNEFLKLSTKFLFINCNTSENENNVDELNFILNDLNNLLGLDYKNQQLLTDQASAIRLIQSLPNIPCTEDLLVIKGCSLITSLVTKQKIVIPSQVWINLVNWILKSLEKNFNSVLCDVLNTLKVLFKGNSKNLLQFHDQLISPDGILINLIKNPNYRKSKNDVFPSEIILSSVLCLESFFYSSDDVLEIEVPDEYFKVIGTTIINLIFTTKPEIIGEGIYCLQMTSALNICRFLCLIDKDWSSEYLGDILGASRSFMMRGLTDIDPVTVQKVMISQQALMEPQNTLLQKGGKVAKQRKPRTSGKNKKVVEKKDDSGLRQPYSGGVHFEIETPAISSYYRTSDSDFSESEINRTQHDRHKQTKLRQSALSLIGVLAKNTEKRVLIGYWHSIFSSESSINLLNCVLKDPSPRCRMTALQATALILYGSKPFLIQAELEKSSSTFTPFSVALGNMISSMYESLTQALSGESSLPVLIQILKCLTILIQASPFQRLKHGLVTNFVKYIKRLVYHKDPTIQVASLMVMGFLISVPEMTDEITDVVGIPRNGVRRDKHIHNTGANELIETEYDEEYDDEYEADEVGEEEVVSKPDVKMSWLLQISLKNLGVYTNSIKSSKPNTTTTPVRIESLQVLSALAPHFLLLKDHLTLVAQALEISFRDSIPEIRLYAGRNLDVIGHSINTHLLTESTDVALCLNFWILILPSVTNQIQDSEQSASLKAICCDALANIGVHVFERLPRDKHIRLISLLTGCGCDEQSTICAAAVRALAVFVLFPSLREDICYVENTAESIIRLMKDQNLQVRVKASWSLGNISDALLLNNRDSQLDKISDGLLKKLLEISIESSSDNDKVRSNAMRTLGNLLRLLTKEHLVVSAWNGLYMRAVEKLIHNASVGGNMKVKWNACYAIGNFMKNLVMFDESSWQSLVYPSLCNIIINSSNFKVRINGAIALSVPTERKNYGQHFINIWSSFLVALEQADHLTDLSEYKHRDNLIEQICLSLSHFLELSTKDDFILMKNELISSIDLTRNNWTRVTNRVLPERAAPLLSVSLKLKELLENGGLIGEQKSAVQTLSSCFIPLTEYF